LTTQGPPFETRATLSADMRTARVADRLPSNMADRLAIDAHPKSNLEPTLFFAQDPDRLSKTARAAALLLWHSCSMHKKAPNLGRPMPFLSSYLGTPLDLFSIWLATQNSFGTPGQSAPEDVSSKELLANGCSPTTLCDQE
jgi:hypothetical protein